MGESGGRSAARPGRGHGWWLLSPWPASLVAVMAGAAFGAGDQYLGWTARSPVGAAFSLMVAPWLLLPFGFGCTRRRGWPAAGLGLLVTLAALAGYYARTLNPGLTVRVEHHPLLVFFLTPAEAPVLLAGLVLGPLYGVLGQRWHRWRSPASALCLVCPMLLEPLARLLHLESGPPVAFLVELAAGLIMAGCFATAARRQVAGSFAD
jgi:hypothetical protein